MDIAKVAQLNRPRSNGLQKVCFVPGRDEVSFLYSENNSLERALWGCDLQTGRKRQLVVANKTLLDTEETLSLDEKLRRERTRSFSVGITNYKWFTEPLRQRPSVLVPLQGSLYLATPPAVSDLDSRAPELSLFVDKSAVGGGVIDPKVAPDGRSVAFVANGELWLAEIPNPELGNCLTVPVRLTSGADPGLGVTYGLADFIAQEEMQRSDGFWWSRDSKRIAFCRVEEGHIPVFRIMHSGKDDPASPGISQEDHRYPFAGAANPRVSLAVLHLESRETVWMRPSVGDGDADRELYIARVNWAPDGSLLLQTQDRAQTTLELHRGEPSTGSCQLMIREESPFWINLHDELRFLPEPLKPPGMQVDALPKGSFSFIWSSERTGYAHLYLYTYVAGACETVLYGALTTGNWVCGAIAAVSVAADVVFVFGNADTPLETHLYAVHVPAPAQPPLPLIRLTPLGGSHRGVVRKEDGCYIASRTTLSLPSFTTVRRISGGFESLKQLLSGGHNLEVMKKPRTEPVEIKWYSSTDAGATLPVPKGWRQGCPELLAGEQLCISALDAEEPLHSATTDAVRQLQGVGFLRPPRIISVSTGESPDDPDLMVAVYLPDRQKFGPGPYPLLVSVYGGPHVQQVVSAWRLTGDVRAQYLRSVGFAIMKCDNRGSHNRGVHFESFIKHKMGSVEVEDQKNAVAALVSAGIADPNRVGIYGWSYGGYMSVMSLCRASETFRAAAAGAPVTSWDGYDTHYTERYMGLPQEVPEGYAASSVLNQVHMLHPNQRLLLIHGLIDENVHFRHSARLINKLIEVNFRNYELLLFPDERHLPRKSSDRKYMEEKIVQFFIDHVKNAPSSLSKGASAHL